YDEIPIENIESIGFNERLKNQQMIAIRSIECTNFKSFEGTVTLGPFSNQFSSILGPNGSGKSNVIDSLLFVFGYRASKIRSKKLSILIHKSSKSQNCNSCSVKINFIYRNQSNSTDHQSSENENTFSIKRTVNLNNSSQYFLDEQPCSYKAVAEKLHYFGVDVHHSRFLILQGEVEQISTMKPKKQPNDSADGMLEYIEDVVGTSCLVEPIQTYESRIAKLKDYEGYLISELKKAEKSKTSLEKKKDETVSFLNSENFVSKIKEESSLKIEELEKILISLNENFNKKTENLNTKTTELKENEKLDKDLSRKLAKKHQNEADLKAKFDDCEASDSKMLQLLTHINQDKSEAEVFI
ncbi:MAG: Structural maintenance of chromosomes protein 4, partial [Paramarteilia canceri]